MDIANLFGPLKTLHLITVGITICGFLLRGYWMYVESPLLNARLVKILPHVNDTLLLLSAIGAGIAIGQYPFVNAWLTAKVLGALTYIVLGAIALTYGRTPTIRRLAFVGALLSIGYVIAVAVTKTPLPV